EEAHGDIRIAVVVTKRAHTQGDVGAARGIVQERSSSGSHVVLACCVGDKGVITERCVAIGSAGGQRLISDGGIASSTDVLIQRKNTGGCVPDAVIVALKGSKAGRRVADATGIFGERASTHGCV